MQTLYWLIRYLPHILKIREIAAMELTPLAVLRCHLQIFGLPSKQKVGRSTIFLDPNCKQTADFVYIFKM